MARRSVKGDMVMALYFQRLNLTGERMTVEEGLRLRRKTMAELLDMYHEGARLAREQKADGGRTA